MVERPRPLTSVIEAGLAPSGFGEPPGALLSRVRELGHAPQLVLFLDYDGTLVPFAPLPELAVPDAEILELLTGLSQRRGTQVHIVSGRPREFLEQWFGRLSFGMHAEHGYWSRREQDPAWVASDASAQGWKPEVLSILADLTHEVSGSFLEEKTSSVAWHYRLADAGLAEIGLARARLRLAAAECRSAVELLEGVKVLEVRRRGTNKGNVVAPVLAQAPEAAVLAAGDDTTDEDLFAALPKGALAIRVGDGPTLAAHRVANFVAFRFILRTLLEAV